SASVGCAPAGLGPLTVLATKSKSCVGWGAWIRTREWRNQNPLPYHLATPQCAGGPYWRDPCEAIARPAQRIITRLLAEQNRPGNANKFKPCPITPPPPPGRTSRSFAENRPSRPICSTLVPQEHPMTYRAPVADLAFAP